MKNPSTPPEFPNGGLSSILDLGLGRVLETQTGRQNLREWCEKMLKHLKATEPRTLIEPCMSESEKKAKDLIASTTGITRSPQQPPPVELEVQRLILLIEWKIDQIEGQQDLRGKWYAHIKDTPSEVITECTRNLLLALYLLDEHLNTFKMVPVHVLNLVAEAQSAIRALTKSDDEQYRTFKVLRQILMEQRVLLPRFMSLNDLANPANHQNLHRRLMACWTNPEGTKKRPEVQQENTDQTPTDQTPTDEPWESHTEVMQARQLLLNQRMVIVGGDARPEVLTALQQAFGCEVIWVATRPTSNFSEILEQVEREEGLVVVLLIRWVRHTSRQLREVKNKILVRVPGGYGVGSIAYQINCQASIRLKKSAVASSQPEQLLSGPDGQR